MNDNQDSGVSSERENLTHSFVQPNPGWGKLCETCRFRSPDLDSDFPCLVFQGRSGSVFSEDEANLERLTKNGGDVSTTTKLGPDFVETCTAYVHRRSQATASPAAGTPLSEVSTASSIPPEPESSASPSADIVCGNCDKVFHAPPQCAPSAVADDSRSTGEKWSAIYSARWKCACGWSGIRVCGKPLGDRQRAAFIDGYRCALSTARSEIETWFKEGMRQADIDEAESKRTACPYPEDSLARHWHTRGSSYQFRIFRAIGAEQRLAVARYAERQRIREGVEAIDPNHGSAGRCALLRDVLALIDNAESESQSKG